MRSMILIFALAGLPGCAHVQTATDLACLASRTGIVVSGHALELDVCKILRPVEVAQPAPEPTP